MGVKTCSKCSKEKSLDKFNKNSASKDGKQSWCKVCVYEKSKNYLKYKTSRIKSIKKWNNKGQGVYGLFSGETCLYVGESSKLNQRKSAHFSCIKNPSNSKFHKQLYIRMSQHDNIYFKVLEETVNHKEQEQVWIEYMTPLYNS